MTGYLAFVGSRDVLEIDGLGPEMARNLVATDYARNLWELYEFQGEAMKQMTALGEKKFIEQMRLKGFDATLPKMLKSLEKAKTAPWERWIKALAIPMVGETLGKVLATRAKLKPEDMEHLPQFLLFFLAQGVEGFGEAKAKSVRDWCDANAEALCKKLFEFGVRPTSVEQPSADGPKPLKGMMFVITGEFGEDRDSLTKKLVDLGAEAKSGVTKKVTHLIVGSAPGKTKLTKAVELGIKQYDAAWLEKLLADNGKTLKADAFAAEEA
jgi:DNA ligase (NAD+)